MKLFLAWSVATATLALFGEILVADPSIAVVGGKYYLIGTENPSIGCPQLKPTGEAVFPMCVSEDLYA